MSSLEIETIKTPKINPKMILGYDMFPSLYANIFLCARKNSGKTTVIWNILKHRANKKSKVLIFSCTCDKDANWLFIREWLSSKEIEHQCFTDLEMLPSIIKQIENDNENENPKPTEEKEPTIEELFPFIAKEVIKEQKPPKPKGPISPEYFFIFDDMSSMLRGEEISSVVKKNRHLKSEVIVSSQYPTDLNTPARNQIDYWILFKGHPLKQLETMFTAMNLDITFEEFLEMYHAATSLDHGFLYVDKNNCKFRINFTTEIHL